MAVAVLREIRLYGPLRAQFGRSHWLAVDTPAEAIRALSALFQGFAAAFMGHKGIGYRVWVGEGDQVDARTDETIALGASPERVFRIAPVLHGNKSGWGRIILGAIVTVVGVYFNQGWLVNIGVSMMLGGAIQLLSPQRPGSASTAKNETSYAFNGPVNVISPGGPVPLLIGRVICGSVVASAGISTDEIVVTTTLPAGPDLPGDEPLDPFYHNDY